MLDIITEGIQKRTTETVYVPPMGVCGGSYDKRSETFTINPFPAIYKEAVCNGPLFLKLFFYLNIILKNIK